MISRRRFLQSSLTAALVPLLPRVAVSADLRVRQSWDVFCSGPTYDSLLNGIHLMRSNQDTTSPASWGYWANVHHQFCPHGKPYFLAWHRGLLYRFEGWLRKVSGDPNLVLPYWNYYAKPGVPPQFLDDTLPLYRNGRTGDDVTGALSLDPFADTILHFQRGKDDSFEVALETQPHNPVHNLIGGIMASISYSPWDPLFWLHHANIDRLWVAWISAGGGRRQPAASNTYWNTSLPYGDAVKAVPGVWTTNTTSYLGYQYDDTTMPTSLPPAPAQAVNRTAAISGLATNGAPTRPVASISAPLGSSRPLVLDEQSISVDVPLSTSDANRVRSLMLTGSGTAGGQDGPMRVVLDGVRLTSLGKKGGYFYKVFLNLPEQTDVHLPERSYLLGTLGAFEISVAQMKASMGNGAMSMQGMPAMQGMNAADDVDARLVFPASEALRHIWPSKLDMLSVSFVRVDGSRHPARGQVIKVRNFRVELDPTP